MFKLGVLASGRGTNLQSIIDSIEDDKLKAEIAIVISDRENAYALERAKQHSIDTSFINPKNYNSKEEYEKELIDLLRDKGVELVIMAGFMRILTPFFISHFKRKIMNIHPSLLPAFPGLNAQAQAFKYGVKVTGCTVHFADEGMDTGPIIMQSAVEVKDNDDQESLAARILEEEHKIFPEAINLFIEDRLKIEGRKVKILEI
ncbi:phosphoribosylglycinamide formyltransferase [Natronospora cellulosivora (SeqCode)]